MEREVSETYKSIIITCVETKITTFLQLYQFYIILYTSYLLSLWFIQYKFIGQGCAA